MKVRLGKSSMLFLLLTAFWYLITFIVPYNVLADSLGRVNLGNGHSWPLSFFLMDTLVIGLVACFILMMIQGIKKKVARLWWILLAVLLFLPLGSVGATLQDLIFNPITRSKILETSYPVQKENNSVATPETTPTSTTDETANWQTYTHPFGSYELRYPSSWTLIPKTGGGGPVFTPVKESEMFSSSWLIISGSSGNPEDTIEEVAKRSSEGKTLLTKEEIVVDGHKAIKQVIKSNYDYATEIYISDAKDSDENIGVMAIYIYNREGNYPSKYQKTFDQILSTFKFVSQ